MNIMICIVTIIICIPNGNSLFVFEYFNIIYIIRGRRGRIIYTGPSYIIDTYYILLSKAINQ